jgi:soluble lytic murein transglycosylase-like protein
MIVLFPLGIFIMAILFAPFFSPMLRNWAHKPVLSRTFTPQVLYWENNIQQWSNGYGLDPNLVATVMQIESCGNPNAVSPAGAQGLFQVMPNHFSIGENSLDPETNARRGMEYLALALLQADGDVGRALAGYNGGHGVIGREPDSWPTETRRYVYWGTGIYEAAKSGTTENATLTEWLEAGGLKLCVF